MIHGQSVLLFVAVFSLKCFTSSASKQPDIPCEEWTSEFYFLIDTSETFIIDIDASQRLLKYYLLPRLMKIMPESKVGLGEFNQKPVAGTPGATCFSNTHGLTSRTDSVLDAVMKVVPHEIDTPKHATNDAMWHSLLSREVGWSVGDGQKQVFRTLIIFTDTLNNQSGDATTAWPHMTFLPHDGSPEPQCLNYDYPSDERVKQLFKQRNVFPIFVICDYDFPGSLLYWDNWMAQFIAEGGDGMVLSLYDRGYTTGPVEETIDKVLKAVDERTCQHLGPKTTSAPSTTTTKPTTTTTMTKATTTTTTTTTKPTTTTTMTTTKPTTTTTMTKATTTTTMTTTTTALPPQEAPPTNSRVGAAAAGAVAAVIAVGGVAAAVAFVRRGRGLAPQEAEMFFDDENLEEETDDREQMTEVGLHEFE